MICKCSSEELGIKINYECVFDKSIFCQKEGKIKEVKEQPTEYLRMLEEIFNANGELKQRYKLAEECSELIQAVLKGTKENFIEEMADVSVVIDQFLYIHGLKDKVDEIKKEKAKRTISRMKL